MNKKLKVRFVEVDADLYKIIETETKYTAFVLLNNGDLKEVNPGRIMAVGIPVSEEEFLKAQKAAKPKKPKASPPSFRNKP